jgi:diaminohydroxyphosphoribosylaminopyrimidine deaminase/5-amino-6-(5-phosphoribosylamino)uracil reductase
MSLALALGRRGLGNTWPNPAVGAVIARLEGGVPVIVGRGWTQPGGRPHAEVEALRRAGEAARGATLYVTLEPCSHHGKSPPCADAIVAAGIARVVSALEDPNPEVAGQGHARLRAAGIAVEVGLGSQEARRAHAGHLRRMVEHRPQVTLKLALSADRKVGAAGRRPVEITGAAARARVHRMRAMNDAILIGIGTALADDPQLTCRLPGMEKRSPVRVVLDTSLRLPPGGALAKSARETPVWVVTGPDASAARRARHLAPDGGRRADRRGVVRRGKPGRRGGAVPVRQDAGARRHRRAGGPFARRANRQHDAARLRAGGRRQRRILRTGVIEHDPEKWVPVFGTDHAQTWSLSEMTIRRNVISV